MTRVYRTSRKQEGAGGLSSPTSNPDSAPTAKRFTTGHLSMSEKDFAFPHPYQLELETFIHCPMNAVLRLAPDFARDIIERETKAAIRSSLQDE